MRKKQVKSITPQGISKKIHQSTKKPSQTIHYTDVKKIPQPSIPEEKTSKQFKPWEVNFRLSFGIKGSGKFPIKAIEHLARLLKLWIESSDRIISFKPFFYFQDICGPNIANWSKTCPSLKEAYRLTLLKIAGNRERLAFFKEGDFKTFAFTQGLYDPQWKTQELYFNDLKKQIADKQQSSTINLLVPTIEQLQKEEDECRKKTYSK